jgi:hypothetical protein
MNALHVISFRKQPNGQAAEFWTQDDAIAEEVMRKDHPLYGAFYRNQSSFPLDQDCSVERLDRCLEQWAVEAATPLRQQAVDIALRGATEPIGVSELRERATEKLADLLGDRAGASFGHGNQLMGILHHAERPADCTSPHGSRPTAPPNIR